MNLFDPNRPRLGDRPMLLGIAGVVPSPAVSLLPGGQCELQFWCPVAFNRYAPKYKKMALEALSAELLRYAENPEGYLEGEFGVDLEAARQRPEKAPPKSHRLAADPAFKDLKLDDLL